MKLSTMLSDLAKRSRDLEKQADAWSKQLDKEGKKLSASLQAWMDGQKAREEELKGQVAAYLSSAGEQVRSAWKEGEESWNAEVARLRQMATEAQSKAAARSKDGAADLYEAYAAHAVAFAQKAQDEASKAVAAAAEARAKAKDAG